MEGDEKNAAHCCWNTPKVSLLKLVLFNLVVEA